MNDRTENEALKEGKRKPSDLLLKAVSLWAAALAAMPLFACGARLAPVSSPLRWLTIPCLSFFMSATALIVPSRKARQAAVCAVMSAAVLSFFIIGRGMPGFVAALACAVLCFVCLSRRSSPPGREWGYVFWVAGLIFQLILCSMFSHGGFFDHPDYPRTASVCGVGTCFFFLLFLLFLNRMTLIGASHADITARKVPFVIRFRNTGAVIFLFVLAMTAGFSEKIKNAVSAAWNGVLFVVGSIVRFFMSLFSYTPIEEGAGGGEGGGDMLFPADTAEPSLFAVIFEKVFMVLASLLALFLLILALRVLWKALIDLAGQIRIKISGMMDRASEDYTETVDDTRSGKQDEAVRRRRFGTQKEARPQNGTDLVRYLYRRFLKKHPERQGLTCREALNDSPEKESFAELYERARYGGQTVDLRDSEALERRLGKKA